MFQLLFHLLLCLPFFVCYEVVGLLTTESHQNNSYLCCWLVMSLNTLCLLIRDIIYIRLPLLSIYAPSEAQYGLIQSFRRERLHL